MSDTVLTREETGVAILEEIVRLSDIVYSLERRWVGDVPHVRPPFSESAFDVLVALRNVRDRLEFVDSEERRIATQVTE